MRGINTRATLILPFFLWFSIIGLMIYFGYGAAVVLVVACFWIPLMFIFMGLDEDPPQEKEKVSKKVTTIIIPSFEIRRR